VAVLCALTGLLAAAMPAAAITLPPGFQEDTVFSGLTQPTAMAFSPDGHIFVAEKSGLIKMFTSLEDTSPDVVADLRTQVHDYWDRGLLGMALDPNFPMNNAIYVLYTYDAPIGGTAPTFGDNCADPTGNGCVVSGRLSKLTNIGGFPSAVNEQVLINDWCQQYPSHSIGSLSFGPDGALYVSGGEGASFDFVDYGQSGSPVNPCGDPPGGVGGAMSPPTAEGGALRAQDLRTSGDPVSLDGAILRLNPSTGQGMPDNPLASSSDPNARRIIAEGLRNPFRMTFRPGTNELWVGDVGWGDWEEIDRITDPKVLTNFGWPCYEGDKSGSARQAGYDAANLRICEDLYAQPGAVTAPYIAYKHGQAVITNEACPNGGSSITGLTFLFYPGGPYPAEYDNALFFADYSRNCIWVAETAGGSLPSPSNIKSFVGGAASPVQLVLSPGGEIMYVDLTSGTIRRIRYVAGAPSTEDKARNRPTSASSTYSSLYASGNAVDGDVTTRWSSTFTDNQWWQVDLGSVRQVDSVRVNWEDAYASQYRISTSTDGTNFTTGADVSINQAGVNVTTFAARGARYVRITGLQRATQYGISFWDANVFGPSDTNTAPTARMTATPTSGAPPLTVNFDGSGSTDPNGDPLTYAWDLDGDGAFDDSTAVRPSWTYATSGLYRAALRVNDGKGGTDTTSQTISVGAPTATISTPASSLRWSVGTIINFSGSAVDSAGSPIPASGLTWSVILHHGLCPECHDHFLQTYTGVASGSFPAPDHEYPSELELKLTATDRNGATGTTSVHLQPQTTNLTFASSPTGLSLVLNGAGTTTPYTRTVITGSSNTISAPSPQTLSGVWAFRSWSDGGAQTHGVTAPTTNTTYTATFAASAVDKALNAPTSASSVYGPGYESGKAVDGNSTTRWSSTFADGQWWEVDLGSTRQVDTVSVNWEAAYASQYRISVATKRGKYTTVKDVAVTQPGVQTTSFAAVSARWVRITGLQRATQYGISFWDVNIFGPGV
jgi:glucose/arabinose dehydrogenase/PKD repeat protein